MNWKKIAVHYTPPGRKTTACGAIVKQVRGRSLILAEVTCQTCLENLIAQPDLFDVAGAALHMLNQQRGRRDANWTAGPESFAKPDGLRRANGRIDAVQHALAEAVARIAALEKQAAASGDSSS